MFVTGGETKDQRNAKFAAKLFKQTEFQGIEGSANCVRQMFDKVKREVCAKHGWGF
jgi:hypothetical protein